MSQLTNLPDNLPIPEDDGGAAHLLGLTLPNITLNSTNDVAVNLSQLPRRTVIYCYPMTGRPDVALPDGWEQIPGARGCTPQSCSFRDHYAELQALDTDVYGLSTQTTEYQQEAVARLHLPFPMLSDAEFAFTDAMNLPTMHVAGMRLIKRTTLIIEDGRIAKLFYPVFPPDKNVDEVLAYLRQ